MICRKIIYLVVSLFVLLPLFVSAQEKIALEPKKNSFYEYGNFRVLNKITDKFVEIKAKSNSSKNYFENLSFELLKCWKAPSHADQENAAFVRVYERYGANDQKKIFSGWIFSDNSFLTNIEHQQYDLKLLSCAK
ncbi:MAG: DUF2155 domain-containing protein [Rickettsiales bacterium]